MKGRKLLDTQSYTKQYWLQSVPPDIQGDKGNTRSGIIVISNSDLLPKI